MKQKKTIGMLVALLIAASLFFVGCSSNSSTTEKTVQTSQAESASGEEESTVEIDSSEAGSVTITDMSGDKVTIEGKVEKIINLWPAGTSSFFAMGAGDLIVGVGSNTKGAMNKWTEFFYPGCFDIMNMGGTEPSVEEVIAQVPDLVIIHPSTAQTGIAQQIRDAGIPAININFSDYETMVEAYTVLGEILGGEYQEKLTQWCTDIQSKLEEHRKLTADLTDNERPVVYYIAGQNEDLLTTMATGSIMQDWIESNGGIFASGLLDFTGSGTMGTDITAEEVFALNPDVIIVGGVYQHSLISQLNNTDGWKDLDAVRNGRVYNDPYGCFNWDRFGLESLLQVDYALMCIQPEIAAENGITRESMIEEIQEFYKFYNGKELTAEEAEYMLDGLQPDGTAEYPV